MIEGPLLMVKVATVAAGVQAAAAALFVGRRQAVVRRRSALAAGVLGGGGGVRSCGSRRRGVDRRLDPQDVVDRVRLDGGLGVGHCGMAGAGNTV